MTLSAAAAFFHSLDKLRPPEISRGNYPVTTQAFVEPAEFIADNHITVTIGAAILDSLEISSFVHKNDSLRCDSEGYSGVG